MLVKIVKQNVVWLQWAYCSSKNRMEQPPVAIMLMKHPHRIYDHNNLCSQHDLNKFNWQGTQLLAILNWEFTFCATFYIILVFLFACKGKKHTFFSMVNSLSFNIKHAILFFSKFHFGDLEEMACIMFQLLYTKKWRFFL